MTTALPTIKVQRTRHDGQPTTPVSLNGEHSPISLSDAEPAAAGFFKSSGASTNSATAVNASESALKSPPVAQADASSNGDVEKAQPAAAKPKKGSPELRQGSPDPVTLQILRRTGTDKSVPHKFSAEIEGERRDGIAGPGKPSSGRASPVPGTPNAFARDKKKGVSFLSRIIGSKKREQIAEDEISADGEQRTNGMDASVFSQPIGYKPEFPAPPKYIRIHSHHKPARDFNQTFLAQELYRPSKPDEAAERPSNGSPTSNPSLRKHRSGAIWAMKFSNDGKYLAAAGQDAIVRVWQVIGSKAERTAHEKEEDAAGSANSQFAGDNGTRLNAPVFKGEPIREYHGHSGDILDLSWSKNNFLLSSSMDKTVRLWHITRKECLCCFQHSDFVTSIVFHPRDDRFFLAGSLDSKLRLWSIPDKSVAFWNELPDLITAVSFTPDGKMAIAGCLSGLCLFYETEGLRYHTQVHVRSSHGRNAKGSKITGIETMTFPPDDPNGEVKVLITSNDSRVRIYNVKDKSLDMKFKGYENTCSQIHATFSDDAKYIISGSEDRKVYVWNLETGQQEKRQGKRPVEFFEANNAIVTVAVMAPTKTRQLLGCSEDPLYDLCTPPPVRLVERNDSLTSSKQNGSSKANSDDGKGVKEEKDHTAMAAHHDKSIHPDGNIIVTADYTGRIKVFRQDCAFQQRRHEVGSIAAKLHSGIRRKNSTKERASINSWRTSIQSARSIDSSLRGGRSFALDGGSLRHRSISPQASTISITSNSTPRSHPDARSRAHSLLSDGPRTSRIDNTETSSFARTLDEANDEGVQGLAFSDLQRKINGDSSINSLEEETFTSDGEDSGSDTEATVKCKRCASTSFKAKQSRKGEHKLVCVKCGTSIT